MPASARQIMIVIAPLTAKDVRLQAIIRAADAYSTGRIFHFRTSRGRKTIARICVIPSTVSGRAAVMPTERPNRLSPLARIIMAA